jgi:hypothetical protein
MNGLAQRCFILNTPAMENMVHKTVSAKQPGLFDEIPIESPADGVVIVRAGASDAGDLSPLQKKFNAHARKIEDLRRRIGNRAKAYNELLAYWANTLAPVETKSADAQKRLAFAVDARAAGFKLGVRQRETVGTFILGLLNDAFSRATPETAARELFNRWNDLSFEEELEQQKSDMAELMSEMLHEHLGLDIDGESLRNGPEGFENILERAIEEAQAGEERSQRQKTKKKLAKEERERLAEELAKKSLRSLYLSLAKILHPDTEPDAAAKADKEKLMKEVSAAYETGDLHTLLRIENEWINRESSNSKLLSEEKLKVYTSALKEQAQDLEYELEALSYAPQYAPIQPFITDDIVFGKHNIDSAAGEEKARLAYLKSLVIEFSSDIKKQDYMERVRALVDG